jgi:hypothetical protein
VGITRGAPVNDITGIAIEEAALAAALPAHTDGDGRVCLGSSMGGKEAFATAFTSCLDVHMKKFLMTSLHPHIVNAPLIPTVNALR